MTILSLEKLIDCSCKGLIAEITTESHFMIDNILSGCLCIFGKFNSANIYRMHITSRNIYKIFEIRHLL